MIYSVFLGLVIMPLFPTVAIAWVAMLANAITRVKDDPDGWLVFFATMAAIYVIIFSGQVAWIINI